METVIGILLVAAFVALAFVKKSRERSERRREIARERHELTQEIQRKYTSVKIARLEAPPGASASVEVED